MGVFFVDWLLQSKPCSVECREIFIFIEEDRVASRKSEAVLLSSIFGHSSNSTPTLTLSQTSSSSSSSSKSRKLEVIVKYTSSSSKCRSLLEINLIHIRPRARKSLLLHRRREQPRRREADVLSDHGLALALASQSKSASKRNAGNRLLRRSNAAKVETLQREVGCLGAGGFESRGVAETGGEDVLDGYVGFGLSGDADGSEGHWGCVSMCSVWVVI